MEVIKQAFEKEVESNTRLDSPMFKPKRKIPYAAILGVSITLIVAVGVVLGLMWQSNSFIARNQDIRSDASSGKQSVGVSEAASILALQRKYFNPETVPKQPQPKTSTTGFVPGKQFISPVDQRFGLNGGCDYTKKLGLGWTYNWGWMTNKDKNAPTPEPDNVNEIRCYENNRSSAVPINTLITLAKNDGIVTNPADNSPAAWTNTDVTNWINKAKQEGKWNAADQAGLVALETALKIPTCDIFNTVKGLCTGANPPKLFFLARMKANYAQIPYIAARYPGAHYQISNEPDFGFSYMPAVYAKVYRAFYDRIKRYDPNAKVAMGSIGLVEYDHWFNKNELTFNKNTGYDEIMALLAQQGMATAKNSDIAWLALVYKEYYNQYKTYPDVDFVGIHPYPWPPALTSEYLKMVNGTFYSYQWPASKISQAVTDTLAQIDKFKAATAGAPYGYSKKPIWITEINVLVNKNPTAQARDAEAAALQKPFMQQLYQQLINTNKVQKVFWHTGLPLSSQPSAHIESGFVFETSSGSGIFNVLGEELKRQKALYPDTKPPTVASVAVSKLKMVGAYDVAVTDSANTGQKASGIHRLWYTTFASTQNPPQTLPSDIQQWKSVLTTAGSTITVDPGAVKSGHWLAVQAEDAYGNVSTPFLKKL